jgi:hypothetical protein
MLLFSFALVLQFLKQKFSDVNFLDKKCKHYKKNT